MLNEKDSKSINSSANSTTALIYNEKPQAPIPTSRSTKTVPKSRHAAALRSFPACWLDGMNGVGTVRMPREKVSKVWYDVVYPAGYRSVCICEDESSNTGNAWFCFNRQCPTKCPIIATGTRMLSWLKNPFRDMVDDFVICKLHSQITDEQKSEYKDFMIFAKVPCEQELGVVTEQHSEEKYDFSLLNFVTASDSQTTLDSIMQDLLEGVACLAEIYKKDLALYDELRKEFSLLEVCDEQDSDPLTSSYASNTATTQCESRIEVVRQALMTSDRAYKKACYALAHTISTYFDKIGALSAWMASKPHSKKVKHYFALFQKYTQFWFDQEVSRSFCPALWTESPAMMLVGKVEAFRQYHETVKYWEAKEEREEAEEAASKDREEAEQKARERTELKVEEVTDFVVDKWMLQVEAIRMRWEWENRQVRAAATA